MPIRSMTRRDRWFAGTVKETISPSASWRNPKSRVATAASVAYPRSQCSRASRQPISTHGVKCALNRVTRARPTNPTKSATPGTSTAQSPNPCRAKWSRIRVAMASLSPRSSGFGKNSMTRGSAFITAKAGRSSSRHRRRWRRGVRSVDEPVMSCAFPFPAVVVVTSRKRPSGDEGSPILSERLASSIRLAVFIRPGRHRRGSARAHEASDAAPSLWEEPLTGSLPALASP